MEAGEVALEHRDEAPVERLALVGALVGGVVVPAFDPQQQRREQVALEIDGARVRRSRELRRERDDRALEGVGVARRHVDGQRAATADQPGRRGLEEQLAAEAHDRAAQPARLLEDVDLPAADHGHGQRPHGGALAVDQVRAGPGPRPQQLVVVVAMR